MDDHDPILESRALLEQEARETLDAMLANEPTEVPPCSD
jgi:hypothetical protein